MPSLQLYSCLNNIQLDQPIQHYLLIKIIYSPKYCVSRGALCRGLSCILFIIPIFIYSPIETIQMSHSGGYSKEQTEELHTRHQECFNDLNSYLEKLSTKLQKDAENMEAIKLEEFKDDLIKTKSEFDDMNERRKDKAIKKAVYAHKKQLEKECSNFLQKSIEVNRIYQGLKQKLVAMESTECELDDQIKYLHKQIKIATNKNQCLRRQHDDMQEWYQFQRRKKMETKASVLGQRALNTNNLIKDQKQIEKIQNRTRKWEESTEERLRTKIENTKELINSLVFTESTLEKMFMLHDPSCYRGDKKKLLLMESLLSQERTKKQLYHLLFQEHDS